MFIAIIIMIELPKDEEFWNSERGLEMLSSFANFEMTREEVAKRIGITQRTLNSWLKNNPLMKMAYSFSEQDFISLAEAKLRKAILNEPDVYTEEIITEKKVYDEDGVQVAKVVTKKLHKKPITTDKDLIKFYLVNRSPARWKMVPEPIIVRDVSKMEEIMQEWSKLGMSEENIIVEEKQEQETVQQIDEIEESQSVEWSQKIEEIRE